MGSISLLNNMNLNQINNLLEKTSYPKDNYPSYDWEEVIGIISMISFMVTILIIIIL
jgi:hypothetical protein